MQAVTQADSIRLTTEDAIKKGVESAAFTQTLREFKAQGYRLVPMPMVAVPVNGDPVGIAANPVGPSLPFLVSKQTTANLIMESRYRSERDIPAVFSQTPELLVPALSLVTERVNANSFRVVIYDNILNSVVLDQSRNVQEQQAVKGEIQEKISKYVKESRAQHQIVLQQLTPQPPQSSTITIDPALPLSPEERETLKRLTKDWSIKIATVPSGGEQRVEITINKTNFNQITGALKINGQLHSVSLSRNESNIGGTRKSPPGPETRDSNGNLIVESSTTQARFAGATVTERSIVLLPKFPETQPNATTNSHSVVLAPEFLAKADRGLKNRALSGLLYQEGFRALPVKDLASATYTNVNPQEITASLLGQLKQYNNGVNTAEGLFMSGPNAANLKVFVIGGSAADSAFMTRQPDTVFVALGALRKETNCEVLGRHEALHALDYRVGYGFSEGEFGKVASRIYSQNRAFFENLSESKFFPNVTSTGHPDSTYEQFPTFVNSLNHPNLEVKLKSMSETDRRAYAELVKALKKDVSGLIGSGKISSESQITRLLDKATSILLPEAR